MYFRSSDDEMVVEAAVPAAEQNCRVGSYGLGLEEGVEVRSLRWVWRERRSERALDISEVAMTITGERGSELLLNLNGDTDPFATLFHLSWRRHCILQRRFLFQRPISC